MRKTEAGIKLILLDFGAVQKYPTQFIKPVCGMIRASYERDLPRVIDDAIQLKL